MKHDVSAYVLTRPLGASFADWLGKAHAARGLVHAEPSFEATLAEEASG